MKDVYNKTKDELFADLQVSAAGLTSAEAAERLKKYGPNAIQEGEKQSVLRVFLQQFTDFLVIILLIAAFASAFLGDIESAAVILIVVTINAILGTVQHVKAEQSLESLKKLSAPIAKVLRDGQVTAINSDQVTIGDILYFEAGDYVCADGRILSSHSAQINESSLTGESVSVEKTVDVVEGEVPIGDRMNMAFSGSFVTYGRCSILCTGIGMQTEIGKVASLLKSTQAKKTPLQESLDQFGKKLSIIILIICAVLFAINIMRGGQLIDAFMFAVALAVAAIPEALSSIVTIVLSFGTQKMAKENAIIRKLHAVEGLGSVSIICSDKTGTLTQNKMTIKKYAVSGEMIDTENADFSRDLDKKLLYMGVLCNDSTNQEGKEIGDPTEVALINFADQMGYEDTEIRSQFTRVYEIPFDSDRKLMSAVYQKDGKSYMITKGAVDVLLDRVTSIETYSGVLPFQKDDRKKLESINQQFSESGLRVLAFAAKEVPPGSAPTTEDEKDYIFVGLMAMMDPPREESKAAVAECIKAGIRPIMITGDHKVTASAIAKEIGILTEETIAVEGAEIEALSDEELKNFVTNVSVYARVSPEHKIRIVRAWQERENIVAMTGDGVNDAPALKQADIGVAMGITGSEVAKDAASMVLTDDNFATIVKAVENGRNLYANIKNSIKFLLSGNTAGILAVLYASLLALPVPFAPVHLLFINLLTDSLPAIALGVEAHKKAVMKEKPRPVHEPILTKRLLSEIVVEGLFIAAVTIAAFYIGLASSGEVLARTMAFSTLCLSRLIHGFNCKGSEPVLFSKRLFNNRYLWGAFFIGFVLLNGVLLLPPLHSFFMVTPLTSSQLLSVYGLSLLPLLCIQLMKYIQTRK